MMDRHVGNDMKGNDMMDDMMGTTCFGIPSGHDGNNMMGTT